MGFTARIEVTGICGIVPRDNDHGEGPPGAFCVVVPKAWDEDRETTTPAIDGMSQVRRHTAFMTFAHEPRDGGDNRQDLVGLWHLAGHRVFLQPTFEDGQSSPAQWGTAMAGLATWTDVADPCHRMLFTTQKAVNEPSANIAAQLIVKHGTLSAVPGPVPWAFDPYLLRTGFRPREKNLNHRATFSLENLAALDILEMSFEGEQGRSHRFTQDAYIRLANLCDDNPLQWGAPPKFDKLPDDDDFRLHYSIVDNPQALSRVMDGFRCPIPRLKLPASEPAGNGLNCDPKLFPATHFTY